MANILKVKARGSRKTISLYYKLSNFSYYLLNDDII